MDRWLNDRPALAYVNELCAWVVVNNKSELISWTDDPAEIAWLSLWVLQYKATVKEADRGTDNRALKAGGRRPSRVSPRRGSETRGLLYGSGKEGDSACQLKPLRTLESKQLKLSVTAANKSLRGFEANSLPLDFMT